MRLPARNWIRRLHLILGLALGAVLVAVAGSGAALVFRDEIRALDPAKRQLDHVWNGKEDMGFSAARDLARAYFPDHQLQTLWFPNQVRPYYEAAYLSPEGEKYSASHCFHPANGEPVTVPESPILKWIEHFHVNLHLGEVGGFLVRWCTLLFSLVLLSGLYLWWPGLKPHLWFGIRKGKLRLWDAHRVLGFAATIPLLLMLISGVVFAFPAAREAVFYATSSSPPESAGTDLGKLKNPPPPSDHLADITDQALLDAATDLTPAEAFVFYITFPIAPDETRQVRLQRGYSPFPYGEVHRIYFDRYTGEVLGHLRPDDKLASRYINSVNSELHYGTIGGLFTKIPWFIACALVPFFAVTGVLLWRRRARRRTLARSGGILPPEKD